MNNEPRPAGAGQEAAHGHGGGCWQGRRGPSVRRTFGGLAARAAVLLVLTLGAAAPGPGARARAAESEGGQAAPAAEQTPLGAPVFREQTIYVPYEKFRWVFERRQRGVYLSYDRFEQLWRAARAAEQRKPPVEPPVGVLIAEADNEAEIHEHAVRVAATLTIEALKPGWWETPLRLADAAIQSAELEGRPARIVADGERGYKLLVEHRGAGPGRYVLRLEYAKAYEKAPGANSVRFQAPQAPVNRWRIRVPQRGVQVDIQPLLAAPERVPAAPDAEETVVQAFVGAAPEVRLQWTPKAEGATGLAALASVEAEHAVTVEQGRMRTRTTLHYDISRAPLDRLMLEAPAGQRVTGVYDANVRQWTVQEAEGGRQRVAVELFQPALGKQELAVELEQFLEDRPEQELAPPLVRAVDAARQQGVVVVRVGEGLRAEAVRRTGLLQLDAGELPPSLRSGRWPFAYRYAALPAPLTLRVEKLAPRVRAIQLVEAYLEPHLLTVDAFLVFDVQQAGLFQLEVEAPPGFQTRRVEGRAAPGVAAAAVDAHHVEGPEQTRLKINLSKKALGRVGLLVRWDRRLDDPNLQAPTGEAADIPLPLPRAAGEHLERLSGSLVVYAPESLRAALGRQAGVRRIALKEAFAEIPSTRGEQWSELRETVALAYADEPTDVSLRVQRRRPYVAVRQFLAARIESGVVKYAATFFYDIRYSAVESLRLDVPVELADQIRNQTPSLRDRPLDPQPDDVPEGYVAWELTGERELLGELQARFVWEQKIAELDVGGSVELEVPRLSPQGADRAWGQIAIAKAESLDVAPAEAPRGLRPIDPQQDLMPGAAAPNAALALEFHDAWSLRLRATRYEIEQVKHTSVDRALLRMVVVRRTQTAPQKTVVQGLFRMRSVRQRIAVRLPDGAAFDTDPLRINGRPAPLERGDAGDYWIPLTNLEADRPFVVELRYTVEGGERRLEPPVFPGEPAVQKVYLAAYLPEELVLLGYRGPWTRETDFRGRGRGASDGDLLAWVAEGSGADRPADFPTDGRRYVFSSLSPPPPPDGALRLTAFSQNWLNALIFAALALVGLVMTPRPLPDRLVAAGVVITAIVLAGVFLPTFAESLLGGALAAAVGLVAVLWVLGSLASALRRRAASKAEAVRAGARPSSEAAPAAAESTEPPPGGTREQEPPPEAPADEGAGERSDEGDQEQGGPRDG